MNEDPFELPDLGLVGNFNRSLDAVLPRYEVSDTDRNLHGVAYMLNSYSDVWEELLPLVREDSVLLQRTLRALELRAQFEGKDKQHAQALAQVQINGTPAEEMDETDETDETDEMDETDEAA